MEDMRQLTERLTEYKYKSSYGLIVNVIAQYALILKMDVANFFEVTLFLGMTGNNDSLFPANGRVGTGAAFLFVSGGGEGFLGGEEFFQQLLQ